jgi:hypothetical protein
MASVVVGIKVTEDQCYSNAHYAKVGGLQIRALNRMELALSSLLDFRLHDMDPDHVLLEVLLQSRRCLGSAILMDLSLHLNMRSRVSSITYDVCHVLHDQKCWVFWGCWTICVVNLADLVWLLHIARAASRIEVQASA